MAHFAKIGVNSKVLSVQVVSDNDMLNADGIQDESVGQQFLERLHGWPALMWIQTSYNTRYNTHSSGDNTKAFRGNYAGIGFIWDEDNQIFWPSKPYASWVKHINTATWRSPLGDIPNLTVDEISSNTAGTTSWSYYWDEDVYQANNTQGWIKKNGLLS